MIRWIFRLLAAVALAAAVILVVLDGARSIAADRVILTPLGEAWRDALPVSFEMVEHWFRSLPAFLWDPAMLYLLALPGFAVLAGLALLFHVVGRRPRSKRLFAET